MTHTWTHTTNAVTLPFVTKSRHSVPLIQLCISRVNHLLGSTRLEGKVAQGQTSTIYSFPIFLMQPFSPETNGLLPKIYLKIQRRLDLINGSTFRFIQVTLACTVGVLGGQGGFHRYVYFLLIFNTKPKIWDYCKIVPKFWFRVENQKEIDISPKPPPDPPKRPTVQANVT